MTTLTVIYNYMTISKTVLVDVVNLVFTSIITIEKMSYGYASCMNQILGSKTTVYSKSLGVQVPRRQSRQRPGCS